MIKTSTYTTTSTIYDPSWIRDKRISEILDENNEVPEVKLEIEDPSLKGRLNEINL